MNPRHRVTILALMAVAAMILAVGGMSFLQMRRITGPLYDRLPPAIAGVERNSRLNDVAQLIRYYDEVLTQSARNYAFTQDRQWRERYLAAEPELDRCIKTAEETGDREDARVFQSIDQANQALVAIQHQSIVDVDAGRETDARVLLEGAEYGRQKEIYAKGLERYAEGRRSDLKHALAVSGKTLQEVITSGRTAALTSQRWVVLSVLVALIALGLMGSFAFRLAGAADKRLQMDAERQKFQSRHHALFDSSSDAIMTLDADRFLDCNAATLKMFGYANAEAFTAVHPADVSPAAQPSGLDSKTAADQRIAEAFARGTNQFEWIHRRHNGDVFPAEVRLTAFQMGERRILQATVRDITERKRAEEEQMALRATLQQRQKMAAIGSLARGMAHEINNPIMGVVNYAQLIKDKAAGNAPVVDIAGEIIAESQRVTAMTHNLLDYSQQRETHEAAPASPAEIVATVLPLIEGTARERGIALSSNIPADLPPVSSRQSQIGQVVMALLTNAMEALEEAALDTGRLDGKARTIRLTAQRIDRQGQAWLRLTVQDNGPGIREEIRERVFDPFFTTKDRTRHSGLGLWISRSIVQEHGGELNVESKPGKWTQVHVDLPAVPAELHQAQTLLAGSPAENEWTPEKDSPCPAPS